MDRGYPFSYKTILGTFRNFKDARKAARKELLFAIDAYSVYVEGGVGDSHDYHDNEKPLVKFKPKDALDEDFCIYAEDEYGKCFNASAMLGVVN